MGINPGTRYLGLAVLHGSDLLDWRVKTFRGKWTKEKAKRILEIISEKIKLYEINNISLKKLHPSRRSRNLAKLVNKIKELARRRIIKIYQYSIKEIEKLSIEDKKLNKRNLIEAIVNRYPILHHDLNKEKILKNSYYFRIFEAVALASTSSKGLS